MLAASGSDEHADHIARVVRLAEGVPFLVEELAAEPGVPRSFAESITRRLAALSRPAREVVSAAAVLGRRFDWRLLAAVGDLEPRAVQAVLEEAVPSS